MLPDDHPGLKLRDEPSRRWPNRGSPGLLVKTTWQPQVVVPQPHGPTPRVVVRASLSPDSRMSLIVMMNDTPPRTAASTCWSTARPSFTFACRRTGATPADEAAVRSGSAGRCVGDCRSDSFRQDDLGGAIERTHRSRT